MRWPSFPTLRPLSPPDLSHVQALQEVANGVHVVRGRDQAATVAVPIERRCFKPRVLLVLP